MIASGVGGTAAEAVKSAAEGAERPGNKVSTVLGAVVDTEEAKAEWREAIGKVVRSTVEGITGAGVSMGIEWALGSVEVGVVVLVVACLNKAVVGLSIVLPSSRP